MSYKDHEKLSEEDFERFDEFLTKHYQQPLEEGYARLRHTIGKLLEGRDTNRRYRPLLMADIEDLISTVIFRLVSIIAKLHRERGGPLRDLKPMLNKIVGFVHREELRRIRRPAPPSPDGPDSGQPPALPKPVDDEVRAIEQQLEAECYDECLKALPEHIRTLFRRYYPSQHLLHTELGSLRRKLAVEESRASDGEASGPVREPSERVLNNLQIKIHKWRTGRLEDCMKRCMEARRARHVELEYLRQQRGGK